MARACSICIHVDRRDIEADLIKQSDSIAQIARKYQVSRSAIIRHVKDHIEIAEPPESEEQKETKELNRITLDERLFEIWAQVEAAKKWQALASKASEFYMGMDRVLNGIEKYSKLLGEFVENGSLKEDPGWLKAQEAIARALDHDPDFQQKLIHELDRIN